MWRPLSSRARLERAIRHQRPQPSDALVQRLVGQINAGAGARRTSFVRRSALRGAVLTAAIVGALAAAGAGGYAMTLVANTITSVKHTIVASKQTKIRTVQDAAVAQYGPPPAEQKAAAQAKQIRNSALTIEASYESIVKSADRLLKKVKSPTIRKQVEALLRKAATLAADTNRLLKQELHTSNGFTQRTLAAKARADIARARILAAQARVIAAIAVAKGE